jgi:hypothetical protein
MIYNKIISILFFSFNKKKKIKKNDFLRFKIIDICIYYQNILNKILYKMLSSINLFKIKL